MQLSGVCIVIKLWDWTKKNLREFYQLNLGLGGLWASLGAHKVKNLPANARDFGDALGSIPESGRFPGKGNTNPLQYSCLEIPMDRGT